MKKIILAALIVASLAGCATSKPLTSKCFDSAGNATCKFTPLHELYAGQSPDVPSPEVEK